MWNPSNKPYLHHASSVFGSSNTLPAEIPASIVAYQKYGVKPSIIRQVMRHSTIITYFRDCFSRYYLLYWEGSYLLQKIAEGNGCINRDGISYIPAYSQSLGSRAAIHQNQQEQYALSFREAKPEFQLPAYCFISLPDSITSTK